MAERTAHQQGTGGDVAAQVLALKHEALRLKRSGDISAAKAKLSEAKALERQGMQTQVLSNSVLAPEGGVDSPAAASPASQPKESHKPKGVDANKDRILALKRKALQLKRDGDIEAAKQALREAKQLEASETKDAVPASRGESLNVEPADSNEDPSLLAEYEILRQGSMDETNHSHPSAVSYGASHTKKVHENENENENENEGESDLEADADLLAEYAALEGEHDDSASHGSEDRAEDSGASLIESAAPTFSEKEMVDLDLLREMLEVGMVVPTEDRYTTLITKYKQEALSKKRTSDIEGAKASLRKAKQFEAALVVVQANLSSGISLPGESDGSGKGGETFSDLEMVDVEMLEEMHMAEMPMPSVELYENRIHTNKQTALTHKRNGNLDEAKAALRQAKSLEAALEKVRGWLGSGKGSNGAKHGTEGFSDEEMLDVEMLKEMYQAEMPVPSIEMYSSRIHTLKRKALEEKRANNLPQAKASLRLAKSFETVLEQIKAFLSNRQSTEGAMGGGSDTSRPDIDLDDVTDPEVLAEMIKMGLTVPDLATVEQEAEQQRAAAVHWKGSGDIAKAKAALLQVRKLERHALLLQSALQCSPKE